jgi:ubiquinone/menaquinone biosynthesis C-methylase UbiE
MGVEMRKWAQDDSQMLALARTVGVGPDSVVLDVGCDSRGLIEMFVTELGARNCTGIDTNADAILFGRTLASPGAELLVADVTQWQPDRHFTHVFSVNALQYMHHERALTRMVSALDRGGTLVLAYETAASDIARLRGEGPRQTLASIRNVVFGTAVNLIGWQPPPSLLGRKVYGSTRRLRRLLRDLGLEVVLVAPRAMGVRAFGRAGQMILIARKGGKRS